MIINDELNHHGVKGMKWGVRKNARKKADNYSSKQRTRDRKIYGRGAERRINKRMLKGEGVQSARHNEVVRKGVLKKVKNIAGVTATSALVLGGSAAVTALLTKKGFGSKMSNDLINDEVVNIGRTVIGSIFS